MAPSLVTPSRRSRDLDSDDEYDMPATSRRRITGQPGQVLAQEQTAHQPGTIVRVRLINFVTYKDVEFYPGPSLNMVIGPNGTGKSTLVCAICLGLGWSSQHLGRAKDVGDFVKHGSDKGSIEIELKKDGVKYTTNPIIKATIRKEDNQLNFMLNGKQSTKKACQNIAKSFKIQVDNLCQFLPQDRVVEFAALSPVELLKSTERAIASEEMIGWHDELVMLNKGLKDIQRDGKAEVDELKNLENQQRMAEADVQRLRQREAIRKNIVHLEAARPAIEFANATKALDEAKSNVDDVMNELAELIRRDEPALQQLKDKQKYRDAIRNVRDDRIRKSTGAEQDATTKQNAVAACKTKYEALQKRQENHRNTCQQKKQDIKRITGVIANLQKELEKGNPEVDISALNEQIRALGRQQINLKEETEQIRRENREFDEEMTSKDAEIKRLQDEIKSLDSQSGRQEQILKQRNFDTWKAWQWVQKNQSRFQQPILGPPIVTCSVADPDGKIADMLESLIQPNDMFVLTAQNIDDQKKLHTALKDELHLRSVSTRTAADMGRLRSPMPDQEIQDLGFAGWAKDYIRGPEAVLAMLCEAANLHRNALCTHQQSNSEFQAAQQSNLGGWATPQSTFRVMRRAEYGSDAKSTTVRTVRKAQFWTDQAVDSSVKDNLQQKINTLNQETTVLRERFDENNKKIEDLGVKHRGIFVREKATANEKEQLLKSQKRFESLPVRIGTAEEELKDAQEELQSARATMEKGADETDTILLEKSQASIDYANSVFALQKLMADLQESEIIFLEAESEVETCERRNQETKQRLEAKRAEVKTFHQKSKELREKRKTLKKTIETNNEKADADTLAFIRAFDTDRSLDQHDIEIQSQKDRLDLIDGGNGSVMKRYEAREKQINALRKKVEVKEKAQEELSDKLKVIRDKWEPKLDLLVKQISSSFSHNMGKIHCNGEVKIDKNEDFEQWAIQIFVRFREGEDLTRLDSHRQSGGERAVSTIFYLMSLQTLTRSPFRVVDEINQGMDPRNERLVHSRMVAIATGNDDWQPENDNIDDIIRQVDVDLAETSRSGSSQYFLITPKLLHDLRYDRGMKILCIASGEHLDNGEDASNKISFETTLNAYKRLARPTAIAV